LEVTGVDYYFETNYPRNEFQIYFRNMISIIWSVHYEVEAVDEDSDSINYFYAKDKNMFDAMDDYGFHLDENGEGAFLLMLGKNGVTIVLPDMIDNNEFCKKIYDIVTQFLNMP